MRKELILGLALVLVLAGCGAETAPEGVQDPDQFDQGDVQQEQDSGIDVVPESEVPGPQEPGPQDDEFESDPDGLDEIDSSDGGGMGDLEDLEDLEETDDDLDIMIE